VTNSKRGSSEQFDADMDESLSGALKAYVDAADEARAATDRLLTDGRVEDANAVFNLIIASWKLTQMHDDVLAVTRRNARADVTRAVQTLLDELHPEFVDGRVIIASASAIPRRGFEYVLKATYDETQELQRRANKQLMAEAVLKGRMERISKLPREGLYPKWMHDDVEEYVASCTKKPSAATALDKIKTHASSIGDDRTLPTRQAVQKWIKRILQRSGR